MNSWKLAPFIRFAIPLILGIVGQTYFPLSSHDIVIGIFGVLFLFYVLFWVWNRQRHHPILVALLGILAVFFLFLFGVWIAYLNDYSKSRNFLGKIADYEAYVGVVESEVTRSAKSSKCILLVERVKSRGKWLACQGKVLIYMDTLFSEGESIAYGDELLIRGHADTILPPQNPGEFDYKRYLRFTNVYHRDYISGRTALKLNEGKGDFFIGISMKARSMCASVLERYIHSTREYSILSALVLGVRGELDSEMIQAYSSAGAMHVLSVSGLHVALVFQMLTIVLGFLRNYPLGKWLYYLLSLLLIWGYAFLTGLCPSVMRSVVMFTIILLGQANQRTSNIFNSIACSAFILLIYNPLLIMDVGFQLSYLAVLGIVYLQPKIYRVWEFNSVFTDWVWQITAVSLAAQLVTFPLGALYFHQFPTYFLVSNLFVIPASTIMLYGGIGLLLISWIPVIPLWVGTLLEYFTWVINELLMLNLRIPGALIEGIYLEVWETWLIFAWLGSMILLIERKRFHYLVIAFLLMCVGSLHAGIRIFHIREQKGVFVYQIPKKTAIEWVNGENSVLLTDIDPKKEKGTYRFHIQNNHVRMGIRYTEIIPLDFVNTASLPAISSKDYDLIKQQGQLWLIVKQYCPKFSQIIQSVHPDKVVFIRKGLSTLKDFQQEGLSDLTWIADGSVSPFSVNRVVKSHFQNIYFTGKKGCYSEMVKLK